MCTVTYIPSGTATYLTSNRDEQLSRSKALAPHTTLLANGEKYILPKDPDGGGSWIGLKNNGDAIVLLNGAFVGHTPMPPYKTSRGLILIQLIEASDPLQLFHEMDLQAIEPFTVILIFSKRLYELRWDGVTKFKTELDYKQPHIWSSATLYDVQVQAMRKNWFVQFLKKNLQPNRQSILNFHLTGGIGDPSVDVRMNRPGSVKTVSITMLSIAAAKKDLMYFDLVSGTKTIETFVTTANPSYRETIYV